jgi:hypothetical protein
VREGGSKSRLIAASSAHDHRSQRPPGRAPS